jgi:hypothetical protein
VPPAAAAQVCLLDLEYGLPVQVRDTALGMANDDIPESAVGKEYQLNEQVKAGTLDSSFTQQRPNDILLKLQRTTPYYQVRSAPRGPGLGLLVGALRSGRCASSAHVQSGGLGPRAPPSLQRPCATHGPAWPAY